MSHDHKDLVKRESDAILQAAGWRNMGNGVMRKMTAEEIKADNDRHLEMMRKQQEAQAPGWLRFLRKFLNL